MAAAVAKTHLGFDKKCAIMPTFGPRFPAGINRIGQAEPYALAHDLYGAAMDDGLVHLWQHPDTGHCQHAVTQRVYACERSHLMQFTACMKAGLAGKSDPVGATLPFAGTADLDLCLGDDPTQQIAKACDPSTGAIRANLAKHCVAQGVALTAAVPGCGSADPQVVATCLERLTRCRVCRILRDVNRLTRSCDAFDDGAVNASCE